MVKQYFIKGVTQDWLLKPGMVVYVESQYNRTANHYISQNYYKITQWCKMLNLTFLYIPRFYMYCDTEFMEYMTGQDLEYPTSDCTASVLKYILPSAVINQIKGPSLLFSGIDEDKLIAYQIEIQCKDTYELLEDSILKIFQYNNEYHLNPIERDLFIEPFTRFRVKEMDDRIRKEEKKTTEKEQFKEKNALSGKFCHLLKTLLDEDEDGEAKSTHKRLVSHTDKTTLLNEKEIRYRIGEPDIKCSLFTEDGNHILDGVDNELESITNSQTFNAAQDMIRRLLEMGYSKETIWALFVPIQELSPIHITKDYRIYLTLYKKEIVLTPLLKAVYLFFLKHPEGMYFKDLPSHHRELLQLYRKFAIRGTAEKHFSIITDLVNPLGNSMNEKCSIIKKYITNLLDDSLAKHYYISGGKGELKRIAINPEMIVWE